jgi:CubicO group peptidase (beta-lactamase class C family)
MTPVTTTLQRQVHSALDELVDGGPEIGLQVAVYRRGELIVDAVAGLADRATGRLVTPDTPFFSFSTGKGITSLLAHLLVEDAALTYDTPVVELWPEFGAHGKAAATLTHVLTHTVGVPAMPGDLTPRELSDWTRVCASIAAAEPRWQPGTQTGYHSYTFGYLVGELARRATGQPMHQLLRDRIAEPLGMADELYFGVPQGELARLAKLEELEPRPVNPAEDNSMLALWERQPSAKLGNSHDFLRADVPSVATVTARAMATMYAAMLDGRLIDADQLQELSAVAFEGTDQVFGNPTRMALGYPLGRIGARPAEPLTALGWPGGGGSYAYADSATGTAFALTKNCLTPHFTTAQRISDLVTAE